MNIIQQPRLLNFLFSFYYNAPTTIALCLTESISYGFSGSVITFGFSPEYKVITLCFCSDGVTTMNFTSKTPGSFGSLNLNWSFSNAGVLTPNFALPFNLLTTTLSILSAGCLALHVYTLPGLTSNGK